MTIFMHVRGVALTLACSAVLVAGCSSTKLSAPAPVEDRGMVGGAGRAAPTAVASGGGPSGVAPNGVEGVPAKPVRGIENAGKAGYYTVKPGDRLIRIALENGQNWRDIARWNALDDPNRIEAGEVLRVVPPDEVAVSRPVVVPSAVVVTPVPPVGGSAVGSASVVAKPGSAAATPSAVGDDDIGWIWPSAGALLAGFDEARNKGLDIGGKAGDAVLAAADGKVVYAGAGLRGYGNLVIIKHNNTYLSAYAHNQALLVKEDQTVKKGQKIAEMGNTDADRVKLHFEIRRQGKPVDPTRHLPAR
jgi:lipoprotein NlpD